MPHLSRADRKRLKADIIAGDSTITKMAQDYGVTRKAVRDYKKQLEEQATAMEKRTDAELSTTILDTQAVRKDDLDIIRRAVLDPAVKRLNEGKPLTEADVAVLLRALTTRAKILDGYDNSHKLHLTVIDARDQSTTINTESLTVDALGPVTVEFLRGKHPKVYAELLAHMKAHAVDVMGREVG